MEIAKIIERSTKGLESVFFAVGCERADCAITVKQIGLCSFTFVVAV